MESTLSRTMVKEAVESLKTRFTFGSITVPEETFWSQLSVDQQLGSVNKHYQRPFGDKIAWNTCGEVRDYWKTKIKPGILAFVGTNREQICRKSEWDYELKCRMIGETETAAVPAVVMISDMPEPCARLRKLLKGENWFLKSGFGFRWYKGCITWKAGRSRGAGSETSQPLLGALISIYDEETATSIKAARVTTPTPRGTATFGAKVLVGGTLFGLTAFHPFLKRNPPSTGRGITPCEILVGDEDFLDSLDVDTDRDEESNDEEFTCSSENEYMAALFKHDSTQSLPGVYIGSFAPITLFGHAVHSATSSLPYNATLDWALITIDQRYHFPWAESISILGYHHAPLFPKHPSEGKRVIISRQHGQHRYGECTGETVLIRPPGSQQLVTAYSIAVEPSLETTEGLGSSGESGAIVLDLETNAAYGMIVADSAEVGITHMIAMDDILEDISQMSRGRKVLFPFTGEDVAQKIQRSLHSLDQEDIQALRQLNASLGPLLVDVTEAETPESVEKLLKLGADVNATGNRRSKALTAVGTQGRFFFIKDLLEGGAEVNATDAVGSTALIKSSIGRENLNTIEMLLASGADVNATDKAGSTALIEAASRGYESSVKMLLENGAEMNVANDSGSTALMKAAAGGFQSTVGRLLSSGADVNATDLRGATALTEAVRKGSVPVVERLLASGADVAITPEYGPSPLTLAQKLGHRKIERLLHNQLTLATLGVSPAGPSLNQIPKPEVVQNPAGPPPWSYDFQSAGSEYTRPTSPSSSALIRRSNKKKVLDKIHESQNALLSEDPVPEAQQYLKQLQLQSSPSQETRNPESSNTHARKAKGPMPEPEQWPQFSTLSYQSGVAKFYCNNCNDGPVAASGAGASAGGLCVICGVGIYC